MKLLRSFSWRGILRVAALLSVTSASLQAAHQVLFMGNSFTIGGSSSIPTIFDALANAGGQEDPYVQMAAVGGQDFRYHATNSGAQAALSSRQWTHVVIQNFSTEPTHLTTGGRSLAQHFTWGTTLYDQIVANNAATQVVLYETWSRAAVHSMISGTSTGSTFESTDQMQSELTENYAALAQQLTAANPDKLPVLVAPAGQAWKNSGALLAPSHPDFIGLFGGDNYHANSSGDYINAAVFYATLYKASPVGLHQHAAVKALNLSLTNPEYLETVAWQTVVENGLVDVDLAFLTQPQSIPAIEYGSATFTAVANTANLQIQWYLNGQPVEGANSFSFTIPMVTQNHHGAQVWVVIEDEDDVVQSNTVTLTVGPDETAPEATEVSSSLDGYFVDVAFSERIDPTSATRTFNYGVESNDVVIPVRAASVINEGRGVRLITTAPLTGSFSVGISPAVTDLAGNSIGEDVVLTGELPQLIGGTLLIDFGDGGQTTASNWNNVTPAIGQNSSAVLGNLTYSDGRQSDINLEMVRRFNGPNTVGATNSTLYPASATRDSLYGNTELFGGLTDIYPAFRLVGLASGQSHNIIFYASRTGVDDNRETVYTVTGSSVQTVSLNASGNINGVVTASSVRPDANGTILIEISPGPSNNNSSSFTYLNVLEVEVPSPSSDAPSFESLSLENGQVTLEWTTEGAVLEQSSTLDGSWTEVTPVQGSSYSTPAGNEVKFFRLANP